MKVRNGQQQPEVRHGHLVAVDRTVAGIGGAERPGQVSMAEAVQRAQRLGLLA